LDASTTAIGVQLTWSYVGFPTITLPMGEFVDGLPLGLQLIGTPWNEKLLFQAAQWCEGC